MRAWFAFVLRNRIAVLLVLGAITALAALSASRAIFASSMSRLFLGENPAFTRYIERSEAFGGDEMVIVGFDAPELLSPETRARLERVAAEISEWAEVKRVLTVLDANRIEWRAGSLTVTPYLDEIDGPRRSDAPAVADEGGWGDEPDDTGWGDGADDVGWAELTDGAAPAGAERPAAETPQAPSPAADPPGAEPQDSPDTPNDGPKSPAADPSAGPDGRAPPNAEQPTDAPEAEPGTPAAPATADTPAATDTPAAPDADIAARRAALLEELRQDPFAGSVLVATEGPGTTIIVEMVPDADRKAEAGPAIVKRVEGVLAANGIAPADQHFVGQMAAMTELLEQSKIAITHIFPFTALILLITVWLLFHRLWPAVLAAGVALLAVLWTMGFAIMLDGEISVLMALVPSVILIVAFSDVVHLVSAYLIELGHGRSKEDAILASAEDVGRACLFTSLTTFLGFVSLSFVPTPVFRLFGVVMGFGVAVALIIAMLVTPVLFSFMPAPAPLRTGATSWVQGVVDRVLDAMRRLATGHPWKVIAVFGIALTLAIIGTTRITIETDILARLDEDARLTRDVAWFERGFSGANIVDVYVEAPDRDGLLEPERIKRIAELQAHLVAMPEVDASHSYVDLLGEIHAQLGDDRQPGALPTTRPMAAQYLLLFEMADGGSVDTLLDFERKLGRVRLWLGDAGFRASERVGDAAAAWGAEHFTDGTVVEPTGLAYLLGDWLDMILNGQAAGLTFSVVTIALMMMIALRAFGAGLWSMIPNLFPLLILTGWLGGVWDYADSDVFVVLVIAIGIGVDDTVHFLVRFRSESRRTADRELALKRTFDFAGRAILMTTVILALGFLPFATSGYFTSRILGTLLPACLVLALLADLLLAPAMAAVGWFTFAPDLADRPEPED